MRPAGAYHSRRRWRKGSGNGPTRPWLGRSLPCRISWTTPTSPRSPAGRRRARPGRASPSRSSARSSRPCGRRARGSSRAAWPCSSATTTPPARCAESAAAFLPGEPVAFMPSRGAAHGSGLEPAPHLVGERSRALHTLAAGGLVAVSADALVERLPPPAVAAAAGRAPPGGGAAVRRAHPRAGRGGLRARRHRRGARPVLGPRRPRRHLPVDRPRAGAGRVLRRQPGAPVGVLGIHPALAARPRPRGRPPRRRGCKNGLRPQCCVGPRGGRGGGARGARLAASRARPLGRDRRLESRGAGSGGRRGLRRGRRPAARSGHAPRAGTCVRRRRAR